MMLPRASRRMGAPPWLIAAATFLIVLTTTAALALGRAATSADLAVAGRLTVRIVDADAARRERSRDEAVASLRAMPGVRRAAALGDGEVLRLLGGTIPDALPLPALIDVTLAPGASTVPIRAALRRFPGAEAEDEATALQPTIGLIAALRRLAIGIALGAMAAAVLVTMLVAHAMLAEHRATVDILRALGATDRQLAALPRPRIARDALAGGLGGSGTAAIAIRLIGGRLAALDTDVIAAAGIRPFGWVMIGLLPLAMLLLAMLAAQAAALIALRGAA